MAINDIRLWHVTALWQRKDAHLKKEFIASAPTKEAAIKSAESRLPINIRKADGYKTSARDLGTIKDNKIWFSSDVTSNAVTRIDDPLVTSELIDLFTILWGQEIGWRSTNQSATEKDKLILNRLKNDKTRRELIPQWADECLQFPETDTSDFFRTKLSEYLGSDVKNIEDMIPVSDDEYDMIMSNARNKANDIINEARQSANDIRTQLAEETANLAKIAAALTGQMSWRNVTLNTTSINQSTIDNTEETTQDSEQANETTESIVNEEPKDEPIDFDSKDTEDIDDTEPEEETMDDTIELPTDTTDNTEESTVDDNGPNDQIESIDTTTSDEPAQNDETTSFDTDSENSSDDETENSDKDVVENEEYTDDDISEDDYFDDFPDWDEFDEPTDNSDQYDDTPPPEAFHVYKDEDFEPSLDTLFGSTDEDEEEPEDDEASTSDSTISEQKAYEILLSFKSDILLEALADLTIITFDKGRKKKTHSPAEKTFYEAYPITPDMSESDKVSHLVKYINSCDNKNGMPSVVYVYTKYTIPEDTDDEPFI